MAAGAAMQLGLVVLVYKLSRDWVERFNARGPDGLINGKSPLVSSASLMMRSAKRLLQLLRAVRPYRSMGSSAGA